jgi:hypothetical protein
MQGSLKPRYLDYVNQAFVMSARLGLSLRNGVGVFFLYLFSALSDEFPAVRNRTVLRTVFNR